MPATLIAHLQLPASVKSTDARKHFQLETSVAPRRAQTHVPTRTGHIHRCTQQLDDVALILPGSVPTQRRLPQVCVDCGARENGQQSRATRNMYHWAFFASAVGSSVLQPAGEKVVERLYLVGRQFSRPAGNLHL